VGYTVATGTPPTGVPEPASWALVLVAALGAAAFGRSKQSSLAV
jgi:hypothetical protein